MLFVPITHMSLESSSRAALQNPFNGIDFKILIPSLFLVVYNFLHGFYFAEGIFLNLHHTGDPLDRFVNYISVLIKRVHGPHLFSQSYEDLIFHVLQQRRYNWCLRRVLRCNFELLPLFLLVKSHFDVLLHILVVLLHRSVQIVAYFEFGR